MATEQLYTAWPGEHVTGNTSSPGDHVTGIITWSDDHVTGNMMWTDNHVTGNITWSGGDEHNNDTNRNHNLPVAWLATVPLIVGLIAIVTVIGNAFVIMAYCRDRRIHNRVANLLILNLAISDFIIGLVSLTVNLYWITWREVLGVEVWLLGEIFCKIWLVVDYTATVMSAFTIVLMSLDRYLLVSLTLMYASIQTKKRLYRIIAILWAVTASVFTVLAFAWSRITGEDSVDYSEECELNLIYNVYGTGVQLFVEFIIPAFIIIILNLMVYLKIKSRGKELQKFIEDSKIMSITQDIINSTESDGNVSMSRKSSQEMDMTVDSESKEVGMDNYEAHHDGMKGNMPEGITIKNIESHGCDDLQREAEIQHGQSVTNTSDLVLNGCYACSESKRTQKGHHRSVSTTTTSKTGSGDVESAQEQYQSSKCAHEKTNWSERAQENVDSTVEEVTSGQRAQKIVRKAQKRAFKFKPELKQKMKKQMRDYARHRRAAFVLGVIVGIYVVCWLPYEITNVVNSICDDDCVPEIVWEIVNNILWCNSFINPFLYAATNVHFRRNFIVFVGLKRFL